MAKSSASSLPSSPFLSSTFFASSLLPSLGSVPISVTITALYQIHLHDAALVPSSTSPRRGGDCCCVCQLCFHPNPLRASADLPLPTALDAPSIHLCTTTHPQFVSILLKRLLFHRAELLLPLVPVPPLHMILAAPLPLVILHHL